MASATATALSIEQLRELANDPAATLAKLCSVLSSLAGDDEERVQWACEALENCGVPDVEQLNELLPLLRHEDSLVASWSCKLLARMEQASMPAQPVLVELLRCHGDQLVREEAARALGVHAELSSAARSALEQAATDGGPRFKTISHCCLGTLDLCRLTRDSKSVEKQNYASRTFAI